MAITEDCAAIRAKAKETVECIADSALKEFAHRAVLAHLMSAERKKCFWVFYRSDRANNAHGLLAVVLGVVGVLSLYFGWPWVFSAAIATVIDGQLIFLLVVAALHSDRVRDCNKLLPHRAPALLVLLLLLGGLAPSFGNLYIQSRAVFPTNAECVCTTNNTAAACVPLKVEPEVLNSRMDALYFSAVTMTTLGYGDYAPRDQAREVVIWQLVSTVLLLILTIPLLVSRLATF